MLYLDLIDNIIRTTPITLIEVLCYLSIIHKNLKYIYYAFIAEIITNSTNYILKVAFIEYHFAQRPLNPGYINYQGVSTGCGIYSSNNLTETTGFPSYHAQIITFITTLIIIDKELQLTYMSIGSLILVPLIVCIERVLVRCHTILQVVIGIFIGYITAIIIKCCGRLINHTPEKKHWPNKYTEYLLP